MSQKTQGFAGPLPPEAIAIQLSAGYRLWMWVLLPLTLGVGTLVLWVMSLGWPRSLDRTALTLRSGKKISWCSIVRIGVLKAEGLSSSRTVRLKIYHTGGVCWVPVQFLDDGESVASEVRRLHSQANN